MKAEEHKERLVDLIIDRYMPHATPEELEAARENLNQFAAVMLRVFTRMAREDHERAIRTLAKPDLQ